jgi:hypothetical protein
MNRTLTLGVIGPSIVLLLGCSHQLGYRHFSGPMLPNIGTQQDASYAAQDDHSITFTKDRLEVTLLPMTVDMLNRQFPSASGEPEGFHEPNPYLKSTNPYTYGDWKPSWDDGNPLRFAVFLVKVKNYAYPKVTLDPQGIELVAPNGRRYKSHSRLALEEYFASYAVGYAGNPYMDFRARRDLLLRTLYPSNEMVFSGQEQEGFITMDPLADDVEEFEVHISDMVLRFDYRDQPVETIDLSYPFKRDVYLAKQRRIEAQ